MMVVCRLGCGITMWLKMRAEHESLLCSERILSCKWGCEERIKVRYTATHVRVVGTVPCLFKYIDVVKHLITFKRVIHDSTGDR